MKYRVFTWQVWTPNPSWPNGFEPEESRKRTVKYAETIDEARAICLESNSDLPKRGTKGYYRYTWTQFENC